MAIFVSAASCSYPALPPLARDAGPDDAAPGETAVCGDGVVGGDEDCEDRNRVDGDGCDSNCTFTGCGNGIMTADETCDDGNEITESCAYGAMACMVCNAQCQEVAGQTAFCGNGVTDAPNETCDDGNTAACGTCNATCSARTPATAATGQITTVDGDDILEGETFTVGDGSISRTYTFRKSSPTLPTDIRASNDQTAINMASNIANGLNSAGLQINATVMTGTAIVTLRNSLLTSRGNVLITEQVSANGFVVSGMSGGLARDCPSSTRCVSNDDCASGTCTGGGTCQ